MWVKWKLVLVCSDIVLILTQDTCIVCIECTIGSKIILDTPDDTPMSWVQVEGCFGPFGDSINLNTRKVLGLHRMYQGHGNLHGRT
jgi:hypothetical protein